MDNDVGVGGPAEITAARESSEALGIRGSSAPTRERVRARRVQVGDVIRWVRFDVRVVDRRIGRYSFQSPDKDNLYFFVEDPLNDGRILRLHYFAGELVTRASHYSQEKE